MFNRCVALAFDFDSTILSFFSPLLCHDTTERMIKIALVFNVAFIEGPSKCWLVKCKWKISSTRCLWRHQRGIWSAHHKRWNHKNHNINYEMKNTAECDIKVVCSAARCGREGISLVELFHLFMVVKNIFAYIIEKPMFSIVNIFFSRRSQRDHNFNFQRHKSYFCVCAAWRRENI